MPGRHRVARLLLPQADDVERHGGHGGALNHLDQDQRRIIAQQKGKHDRGNQHADKQHHIHQRHDPRPVVFGRKVGCQRQACGLRHVHADSGEQEGQKCARRPGPFRTGGLGLQQQQRKRHDRQSAKLQDGAKPDVRHPAHAQGGFVGVGAMSDQRPERGGQNRNGDHQRHQRSGNAEFDDHHPVERAGQKHCRQANGPLKHRKPQQAPKRQILGGGICKGQITRTERLPLVEHLAVGFGDEFHERASS
jgi:hypothetical protein